MKPHLIPLLACLACAPAGRADLPPLSPATEIADAAHDPAWKGLFARLAPRENQQSAFEERRFFPFRRKPLVLTGEIRISPARGLSLHYVTPEPRIVIVDNQGVLLRDDRGRDLPVAADGRAQIAISALVDVMRFDLPALQRNFDIHGARTGAAWTIAFAPRDRNLAENLAAVVVSGEEDALDKIELVISAKQRVEILVRDTRRNAIFTDETMARYFR